MAVLERPLYLNIAQYKVEEVLRALEDASQTAKSPVMALPDKLTIEHVMPQVWGAHWPLPAVVRTDANAELEATRRRNMTLNTLGNLTLITGPLNSSLKNGAWASKRPELLKFSKLNLTQYFHGSDLREWDEEAIKKRGEHFFDLMVKMWPTPKAGAQVPAATDSGER